MKKIEIDFGVGETATGEPLDPVTVDSGKRRLKKLACELAGGCSLIPRRGAWLDGGRVIEEDGFTLVVMEPKFRGAAAIAAELTKFIKHAFDQKAVLVTFTEVCWTGIL